MNIKGEVCSTKKDSMRCYIICISLHHRFYVIVSRFCVMCYGRNIKMREQFRWGLMLLLRSFRRCTYIHTAFRYLKNEQCFNEIHLPSIHVSHFHVKCKIGEPINAMMTSSTWGILR